MTHPNPPIPTINKEEIGDFAYVLKRGPYRYRVYARSLEEAREMLEDYLDQ